MQIGHVEKVPQRQGMSWRCRRIRETVKNYDWHYHSQEYELVIHRFFRGEACVGHYQGQLDHNSTILIGPNVPHAFRSHQRVDSDVCETIVIWFQKAWIADLIHSCPELRKFHDLLVKANRALKFSPETGEKIAQLTDGLASRSAIAQLSCLIHIFSVLCEDSKVETLLSFGPPRIESDEKEALVKVQKVSQFIAQRYMDPISLEDIEALLHLSTSSVNRFFATHFSESFGQHLKKYRLNQAAELLADTKLSIQQVSERVGYRNQANFNRQFKEYKQCTPRAYRQQFSHLLR
ncbi:helix-turn-helix transcriptional regulator [Thaumasiovibrio subtropicus]|uniref:helix-turn-helix transcriptional regulator n=1 Tax=Thaumasiovibrio subtropicus TaxID=1891207 RepID=UPI000B363E3B|nr:AraC family transcriptional regulator [Thaumasiovibrio subtropicus]